MKYKFIEGIILGNKPILDVEILDEEYLPLNELWKLSGKCIKEAVKKIEDIKDGKLDYYCFGPEDSVAIELAGKTYRKEQFRNRAVITKAFSDYEKMVDIDFIYNFMKDYRDEILKWEEKTGNIQPGLL